MLVYLVTNKVNGKVYVGQTVFSLGYRWKQHLRGAKWGSDYYFHRAIRKYGSDAFEAVILQYCEDQTSLDATECLYIKKYRSIDPAFGYNRTEGGAGGRKSPETRRRMSESQKRRNPMSFEARRRAAETFRSRNYTFNLGRKHSVVTRNKISLAKRGLRLPEITKQRMSVSRLGHAVSDETREKIRRSLLGHGVSQECRQKMRAAALARGTDKIVFKVGSKHSEETRAKMRSAWVRRKSLGKSYGTMK